MESKIESGKFYLCEYPIGIGGTLKMIVKAIKEPHKRLDESMVVDIISPFGYKYDEMNVDYFVREATESEVERFRSGEGLLG